MSPRKFSPLYTSRLTVGEIYSLNKSTIDLSTPVSSEIGVIGNAALIQLKETNSAFGANLNKSQKSELTGEARKLDKARDEDILEIFRLVKNDLRSRDEEKKSAASKLQLFLAPYKGANRLPLDVESGMLFEMTAKYNASAELKAAATIVSVDALFTSLGANNTAFDTVYNQRTVSSASRGESPSSLRAKAISAYTQFIVMIEQTLNLSPNDTLLALFNQLDELRKQYRPLESGKK